MGWRPGAIPAIHVGGTNGKGTVSTLIEAVLRAGGLRTGLYTSPHLLCMRERIRLAGRPIPSTAFRRGVARLASFAPGGGEGFRTTFEHLTALAFLTFQEEKVDVAVIEVGLGGRLDATNVLPAGTAVLTPISIDHRQILGRTVGRISADKAHILKRGGRALIMPQSREAWAAIDRRCRREALVPMRTAERVEVRETARSERGSTFAIQGRRDYGTVVTGLLGAHQTGNVAAAVAAAEFYLPAPRAVRAVRQGISGARVPGRLDLRVISGRTHLLDGGHNPAAARAVAAALNRHYPGSRVSAVVAMARDKDHRGFLRALAPVVSTFHFTSSASPRAVGAEVLARRTPVSAQVHSDAATALAAARRDGADIILVTGSFLLVAEVLRGVERRGDDSSG